MLVSPKRTQQFVTFPKELEEMQLFKRIRRLWRLKPSSLHSIFFLGISYSGFLSMQTRRWCLFINSEKMQSSIKMSVKL